MDRATEAVVRKKTKLDNIFPGFGPQYFLLNYPVRAAQQLDFVWRLMNVLILEAKSTVQREIVSGDRFGDHL